MTTHDSYSLLLQIASDPPFEISKPADIARYLTMRGVTVADNQLGSL